MEKAALDMFQSNEEPRRGLEPLRIDMIEDRFEYLSGRKLVKSQLQIALTELHLVAFNFAFDSSSPAPQTSGTAAGPASVRYAVRSESSPGRGCSQCRQVPGRRTQPPKHPPVA